MARGFLVVVVFLLTCELKGCSPNDPSQGPQNKGSLCRQLASASLGGFINRTTDVNYVISFHFQPSRRERERERIPGDSFVGLVEEATHTHTHTHPVPLLWPSFVGEPVNVQSEPSDASF